MPSNRVWNGPCLMGAKVGIDDMALHFPRLYMDMEDFAEMRGADYGKFSANGAEGPGETGLKRAAAPAGASGIER